MGSVAVTVNARKRREMLRLSGLPLLGAAFVLAAATALAFFLAFGAGFGNAAVGTLYPPTGVAGLQTSNATVDVSWSAPNPPPPGGAVDGYFVERFLGSTPSNACGSSPTALLAPAVTSCTDSSVPLGTYTYTVTAVWRSWSATSSSSGSVTVLSASASGLIPATGAVGSSAQITAQRFAANSALSVTVGGAAAAITAGGTTGATGSSTVTFIIPAVPNGPETVVVTDASSNTATSATNFTVTASATGLSPGTGTVGSSASILAQGFAPSSALSLTVGGTAATITSGGTTAANGASSLTFTIPVLPHGAQSVVVTDASSNVATSATNFTVTASATHLTPTTGAVGTTGVTILAQGFIANHALTVKVNGTAATITAEGTSGSNGASTVTFTIPAAPNGADTVVVSDGTNSATSVTSFTVAASATNLSPVTGKVGSSASVLAQGFAANSALTVTVGGTTATITSGGTTGSSGSSTVTFTIPAAPNGPETVVVTDAALNSASSGTTFTVNASATGLAPSSGVVGSSATITAQGFAASSALSVMVDGTVATITSGGTTGGNGSATVTFTIPAVPHGAQGVVVTDASSDTATSSTNFTVTSSASGLTPTTGAVGTTGVTILAQGFIANHALTVKVNGTAATITGGGTSGSNGASTVTFTIPAAPNGPDAVVVTDGSNPATSAINFSVSSSATGLAPSSGAVGSSASILAEGFAPDSALSVTVGGAAATITAGGTTAANGGATVSFTVPSLVNGSYIVVVTDASSNAATSATNFTVTASATGLSPATGAVGSSATILAQGFAPSSALSVTVGGTAATITSGGTTGANGASTVTFTIPVLPHGAQSVVVTDASSNTATSATNFTVTASATNLTPTTGAVGTTGVTILAQGFIASHALTVTVNGTAATVTAGGTSGSNGSSTVTFTVPAAPNGGEVVKVSDGTNTATSATNFTVTASATGLTPITGAVGTGGVKITAQGFAANSALSVSVDGTTATITSGGTTGGNGSATVNFTIPAVPNGPQTVVVTDASSNTASSATDFTVTASATGLSPATGTVGSSAQITAQGFAASSVLNVTVDGTAATVTAGGTSGANGASTVTFTIPAVPHGAESVVVTDASSDTATSSTNFTVTASATNLSPTSGTVGTTGVTVLAQGFIANHALTVKVNGTAATITGGGTSGSNGASTVTFTIPAAPNGPDAVVVTDGTNSATSTTNFSVSASATALAPSSGAVSSSASILAEGFALDSALSVTVGGTVATITGGGTTAANGGATVTFTVPSLVNGSYIVMVTDASSNAATSATNFTVTASATGLSPATGAVGSSASILAQGFAPNSALSVTVGGTAATITSGGITGANGASTATFTIPVLPHGAQSVVMTDASSNTATSATNFTVTASATGLTPTTGAVGTTGVTILAQGFIASHALTVTVNGTAATVTAGGTSGSNGSSTVTFTVPAAPNGAEVVKVSDGTNTATSATNFTVTASATGLTVTSGPVGTAGVKITAQGFAANSALTVTVGGTTATITSGGTTGASGSSASLTFTIPAVPNGPQTVVVTDAASNTATSGTSFTVTASATGLSPVTGLVGSSAQITAQGFAAGSALTVTVGGTTATITAGGTTGANGSSTVTFTIPALANGSYFVVVTDASTDTATSATKFAVT
ncbi:MAG: IPT/TIG domain-containing protein [Candidatus Dormiibacterota bacterium]